MKTGYFPDTGTLLMELNHNEVYEAMEISENVCVDLDKDGNLVGIIIGHAKGTSRGECEFSYQKNCIRGSI